MTIETESPARSSPLPPAHRHRRSPSAHAGCTTARADRTAALQAGDPEAAETSTHKFAQAAASGRPFRSRRRR
jgi:hypothetical protein